MLQIGQGKTSPSDWENYDTRGIVVTVDTSASGFKETPHYIVTLEGDSYHWCANGVNAIYHPSPTEFTIYLRWTDDDGHYGFHNPLRKDFAQSKNWHLKWIAVGAPD